MKKKKDTSNKSQLSVFTTDNTTTGVSIPSITQLLNRKSVQKLSPSEPPLPPKKSKKKIRFNQKASATPPPFFAGNNTGSISIVPNVPTPAENPKNELLDSIQEPLTPSNPKIQSIKRSTPRAAKHPLLEWDMKTLRQNTDPMAETLALIFEQGASSALFMVIGPAGPFGVPIFSSTATVNGKYRTGIWTGLKWDPSIVPETWNQFVKEGYAELSPPGTSTNRNRDRNVVRLAFGIEQDEWLLLLRAGPVTQCRGVLAIVSKRSLADYIHNVLKLIQSLPVQKAA